MSSENNSELRAYELRILNRRLVMLNQWDKKAIATIISAFTLLVSTGGLVSCGSDTSEQENEADEQIDQNNNQRINQQNNNQRNESHNEQNEERDDNDQDDNDQDDNDGDDHN